MEIKMRTTTVIDLLLQHRQNHIDTFAEQVKGWKKAYDKYQKELAEWAKNVPEDVYERTEYDAKKPQEPFQPKSHLGDYNELLEMLEHHSDDMLEVDSYLFKQIVKDEFSWKNQFIFQSNTYLGK